MSFALELLNPASTGPFAELTFPAYRAMLEDPLKSSGMFAIGARVDGEPAGFALAQFADGDGAVILSLAVAEQFQRNGIGFALFSAMEDEIKKRGFKFAIAEYSTRQPSAPYFERILKKSGWTQPETALRVAKCKIETFAPEKTGWIASALKMKPAGMETIPWRDVPSDVKDEMKRSQAEKEWYPEVLSPFREEEKIHHETSLALMNNGEIAGWLIIYRYLEYTLTYTNLFVREEHRSSSAGPYLTAAVSQRQLAIFRETGEFPYFIMCVNPENPPAYRFLSKKVVKYAENAYDIMRSSKEF